jgi:hypothetical protein
VSEFSSDAGKISFTFTAESLPWVLPADAAEGFKITKAAHRFSNEKLVVNALKAGKYELKIDGQPIGTLHRATIRSRCRTWRQRKDSAIRTGAQGCIPQQGA